MITLYVYSNAISILWIHNMMLIYKFHFQVPHYQTVYKTERVPTSVYRTQYKTVAQTKLVPYLTTTYVTETKVQQKYVTETKYLTKYQTHYETKYQTKTHVKKHYVTKTQVQKEYVTKYQPKYVTETIKTPVYRTEYKTRVEYRTKVVEKPSYHKPSYGYNH